MADIVSQPVRRRMMQSVRRKNTSPEVEVRRILHRAGYRYRLHRQELPGTPDIVFPKRRKVIFVHGCFWHGHECKKGRLPQTNTVFWEAKISRNRQRDDENIAKLSALGWKSLIIWECELRNLETLTKSLDTFLS